MALTEAKKKANAKWDKEHMTSITCKMRKERAELFKKLAAQNGTTASALIRQCVDDYIAKHE